MPLTARSALTTWQFAPVVSSILILLAACYLLGVYRVGRRHPARPWPAGRTLSFFAGLAVIAVATQSSIGAYDDLLFSVHMIQHLLLIMVAPPLLVFGRPVTLLLHAARNPLHARAKRAVRSRAVTALTWPPAVAVLYAVVVAATHLTPFMDLVLENDAVHNAEHALYLVVGYLFFLPLIGSEPIRWRMPMFGRYLLLLVTMPVDTVVGVILMLIPHELFPAYARAGRAWGPTLAGDLHQGGFIMFAGSDVIMTAVGIALAAGFVYGPRGGSSMGGWLEGIRRAALLHDIAAGGAARPALRPGRTIDDDAALGAYNAYLDTLGDGPERRGEASGEP
jgi:putative copper resistance protein D